MITLGVETDASGSQDSIYGAVGVKGVATGPVKDEYQAVIAFINAHGGMAGRKVQALTYETDSTSGTFASQAQAVCANFTQDHQVFAAMVSGNTDQNLLSSCLAQAQTPSLWEFVSAFDQAELNRLAPYVYVPPQLDLSRLGVWIDQLAALGYFDKGAKIGMVRWDDPIQKRASDTVVKPRLAAHGLALTAEYAMGVSETGSEADVISSYSTEANNAILRFRSEGIDHVLSLADPAIGVLFMTPAQSQGYRPRYGLNSLDFTDIAQDNAPSGQLHRAVSVGWAPTRDVEVAQDPGATPMTALCNKIFRAAGLNIPGQTAEDRALGACDALFFLKTALDRAHDLTPAGLRAAVDSLGTSYQSPYTFSTNFGPGRFDGASSVRGVEFDDGCACFRYVTGAIPAP